MADRDRPARAADTDEGFLRRWARRKADARGAPAAAPMAAEEPGPAEIAPVPRQGAQEQDAAAVDPQDLPDIESLDASSDFTVFMRPGVPAHLRAMALRKLWRSDPIFSKLDGLVEYGEDYTIPSWPKGVIATTYRIGRGFVNELETLATEKAEPASLEPPSAGPAPDPAPAIAATAEEAPADRQEPPQPALEPEDPNAARPAPSPASRPTGSDAPTKRRPRPLPRRG